MNRVISRRRQGRRDLLRAGWQLLINWFLKNHLDLILVSFIITSARYGKKLFLAVISLKIRELDDVRRFNNAWIVTTIGLERYHARSFESISRLAGRESPVPTFSLFRIRTFADEETFSRREREKRARFDAIRRRVASIRQRKNMVCQTKGRSYFCRSYCDFRFRSIRRLRPIPAQSLNLQMQPGASIERTLERREGATEVWAEGKPAPLGWMVWRRTGVKGRRTSEEERGENEEKTRSGSRVLEERKKRAARCRAKEKRIRGGRPRCWKRGDKGDRQKKGKKTRNKWWREGDTCRAESERRRDGKSRAEKRNGRRESGDRL